MSPFVILVKVFPMLWQTFTEPGCHLQDVHTTPSSVSCLLSALGQRFKRYRSLARGIYYLFHLCPVLLVLRTSWAGAFG